MTICKKKVIKTSGFGVSDISWTVLEGESGGALLHDVGRVHHGHDGVDVGLCSLPEVAQN